MRVGDENLENMEAFVLNHFSVIAKQIHADFKMLASVNIRGHDSVIRPVQENLAEQFNRLTLSNVAVRLYQYVVVFLEEQIKVGREIPGHQLLVSGEQFLNPVS